MERKKIPAASVLIRISPILLAIAGFMALRLGAMKHVANPVFSTVTTCLAIQGFLFGFYSTWTNHNERERLDEISRSMSTHYIGLFPDHLNEIIDLVERTERTLSIMADCADYGSFSSPELHEKLLRVIEDVARKKDGRIKVRLLLVGKPAHISRSSPYWGQRFDDLLKSTNFCDCLNQYLQFHEGVKKPQNDEEFREMLLAQQIKVEKDLEDAHVKIKRCQDVSDRRSETSGLFLWIRDDVEAVYLYDHTAPSAQGVAFLTRDSTHLKIYTTAFEHTWNDERKEKSVGA